ncbi:ABC transporter ATP-binding protein [Streptococcus suis]|nr:ABC transporter ATP-binding protein [Streptococcus suis]
MLSNISCSSSITINDLEVMYPGMSHPALQIENLTISSGQCVVVCGPSGSGKSSFLKLLNGLVPEFYPAQIKGEVKLGQTPIEQLGIEDLSYQVASVFQNPSTQFFHSQVLQELVFPCENQGLSTSEMKERLDWVNRLFKLESFYTQKISHLSGGQQQRLALAVAAMQSTNILVLDEPTANLDKEGIAMVQEALQELKQQGKTIIIAEHRLSYLQTVADRYLYFRDGQLELDMDSETFLEQSDEERRSRGLRCIDPSSLLKNRTHRSSQSMTDEEGLSIHHLSVQVEKKQLCYISHLTIPLGQVVGLIGANGSGKTSLAHYLAGLFEDKTASIIFNGERLSALERLKKTAFVMQDVRFQLFTETVRRELLLGNGELVDDRLLVRFGLRDLLERHPVSLSGGEQQRLVLLANLLADKEIFIFDEPTSGLDLQQMQEVAQALLDLKYKQKLVLLISHDDELLDLVCDKIVEIKNEINDLL